MYDRKDDQEKVQLYLKVEPKLRINFTLPIFSILIAIGYGNLLYFQKISDLAGKESPSPELRA